MEKNVHHNSQSLRYCFQMTSFVQLQNDTQQKQQSLTLQRLEPGSAWPFCLIIKVVNQLTDSISALKILQSNAHFLSFTVHGDYKMIMEVGLWADILLCYFVMCEGQVQIYILTDLKSVFLYIFKRYVTHSVADTLDSKDQ